MRISQRLSGLFYSLALCCVVGGGLTPMAACAGGSSSSEASVAKRSLPARFQNGPCGLRSLRGQGGGGADLIGIWHCAQEKFLPARFRNADTDDNVTTITKQDALKWGVRLHRDQVTVSIGLKW